MTTVSADDRTLRANALGHPLALQIVLLKHTYVLPWAQFLFAEGGNDEIRLTFATHDVLVKGSNLNALLASISAQGIAHIQEPARPDRFATGTGPFIREIIVEKTEQD